MELQRKYDDLVEKSKEQSTNFHENYSSIASEMRQRELKRNNLIIVGLPEGVDGSVSDRRQNDMTKCAEIFEVLGSSDVVIEKSMRVGKVRSDNKRLLRVTLTNEAQKYELLKQSRTLRGSAKFKEIFIQPDLTYAQRQTDFHLRRELRSRRENGEDVIIHKGKIVERGSQSGFRNGF